MSGLGRKTARSTAELSPERRLLIKRYMDDWLEGAGRATAEPEEPEQEETPSADRPSLRLAETPELHAAIESDDEAPRRRRGRPPGARTRRQVHFHVDPDQDRLLLHAVGRFGSQQKALIAALHALDEVLALRDQVELLQSENSRLRRLLAEAQALFRSS